MDRRSRPTPSAFLRPPPGLPPPLPPPPPPPPIFERQSQVQQGYFHGNIFIPEDHGPSFNILQPPNLPLQPSTYPITPQLLASNPLNVDHQLPINQQIPGLSQPSARLYQSQLYDGVYASGRPQDSTTPQSVQLHQERNPFVYANAPPPTPVFERTEEFALYHPRESREDQEDHESAQIGSSQARRRRRSRRAGGRGGNDHQDGGDLNTYLDSAQATGNSVNNLSLYQDPRYYLQPLTGMRESSVPSLGSSSFKDLKTPMEEMTDKRLIRDWARDTERVFHQRGLDTELSALRLQPHGPMGMNEAFQGRYPREYGTQQAAAMAASESVVIDLNPPKTPPAVETSAQRQMRRDERKRKQVQAMVEQQGGKWVQGPQGSTVFLTHAGQEYGDLALERDEARNAQVGEC